MRMIVAAIFVAGTLGMLTDWLFMGVMFHDAYNRYPEVWWPHLREGTDRRGIIVASVLGYVMTAPVVGLCMLTNTSTVAGGLLIGFLVWVAGPFVPIVVNGFFIKLDPKITFAHCLGYLARLLLAGIAGAVVMSMAVIP